MTPAGRVDLSGSLPAAGAGLGAAGFRLGAASLRLHFGLGRASTADISIRWLDGKVENFKSAAAGQILTIEEVKGIVRTQRYTSTKR